MPNLRRKSPLRKHTWFIYVLAVIVLVYVWSSDWIVGLIFTILSGASFYYSLRSEQRIERENERYIRTLSHRIKKVGEEALLEMPIGIILYDENFKIEWTNAFMNNSVPKGEEQTDIVGLNLQALSEDLVTRVRENASDYVLELDERKFLVAIRKEERLLYLFDRTQHMNLEQRYNNEQTVLVIIYLDNYEDITQTMDDSVKSQVNSHVTTVLSNWSQEHGLYLKRTSQDRFLAVGTAEILAKLEESRFNILDIVRELDKGEHSPLTLSIGVAEGNLSLPAMGQVAQSSLDLVLGRGGDQVAIKDETGKVRFYGGKTNPMEKRTRVRARVISHALKGLIEASDNVIIMGHKSPDMDSLGAAIGVLNIARRNHVEGYVVFNPEDVHSGVIGLVEGIQEDPDLWQHFIEEDEADVLMTERSLVVVVDTHKPSMVVSEKLLNKTEYRVVIDHHRRGEEFVKDPTLVYMEPYASSTAELITELLEYQPKNIKLTMLEATALLAGIIVDTKSFTLRTGSRTFDAASYLRSKGADTVLVQRFMKEELGVYVKRSKLIERAEIYRNKIAISLGTKDEVFDQVLIAQAADTLLTMSNVNASFVISKRNDDRIGISARSLGDVNVQVIMEQMNGGGHLTNAATQIEDTTIADAEVLLKEKIDEYLEGSTKT